MTRYKAKLDGFDLLIEDSGTADTWEKNVPEYDIPFASGAHTDGLGVRARHIQFTTVWFNDSYEMHEAFIAHCLLDSINTLIHPKYGQIKGRVKSVQAVHRDNPQLVKIDVAFVEDADPDVEPVYTPDLVAIVDQSIAAAQLSEMERFASDVNANMGPAGAAILAVALDPELGILGQIQGLSTAGRIWINKIETAVSAIDAAFANITNPVESLLSTIDYGTTLPGRVIGSVARSVERCALAVKKTNDSPLAFMYAFRGAAETLLSSSGDLAKYVVSGIPQLTAVVMAELYSADQKQRDELLKQESQDVWGNDGTLKYIPVLPSVLTINDIEMSIKSYRETAQAAIDSIRTDLGSPELIKNINIICKNLSDYVDSIKLNRERMIEIDVMDPVPVHLLCLQYGLPYTAAERICAINNFECPNFVSGKVKMYVR